MSPIFTECDDFQVTEEESRDIVNHALKNCDEQNSSEEEQVTKEDDLDDNETQEENKFKNVVKIKIFGMKKNYCHSS